MSFLSKVTIAGKEASPPIMVIVGTPGSGKTTLGGLFPDAIFMQAERSGTVFESWKKRQPALLPMLNGAATKGDKDSRSTQVLTHSTHGEALAQIRELLTADHPYKTLVVDSLTSLDRLFEDEILLTYDVKSIGNAAGGYNKGFSELAKMHADFFYALQFLARKRKMAIVMLAHTGVEKRKDQPDDGAEYGVYSLDMSALAAKVYVANADNVLYLQKKIAIVGHEQDKHGKTAKKGRARDMGDRTIITTSDGMVGYVYAKNRYRMPETIELPHGKNPLLQYMPFFFEAQPQPEPQEEAFDFDALDIGE